MKKIVFIALFGLSVTACFTKDLVTQKKEEIVNFMLRINGEEIIAGLEAGVFFSNAEDPILKEGQDRIIRRIEQFKKELEFHLTIKERVQLLPFFVLLNLVPHSIMLNRLVGAHIRQLCNQKGAYSYWKYRNYLNRVVSDPEKISKIFNIINEGIESKSDKISQAIINHIDKELAAQA
jgi:hypothetical protein